MPNLRTSGWVTVAVADESTASSEIDLGAPYRSLLLEIPTIDSGTVSLQVARVAGGTYRTLSYISLNDGDDDVAVTTAATGAITVLFPFFGCQYFKLLLGKSNTTAAVTFYACGFN